MMGELFIKGIKKKTVAAQEQSYIFSLSVYRTLKSLELNSSVTFFVGENGTGKSTLLEAVAVNFGLNAEGGSKNFNFATRATHSPLHGYITLVKSFTRPKDSFFLRAESFYNVASEVDSLEEDCPGIYDSYGGASLHRQSHGESFLSLVLHRFRGQGFYILDEPEAALSPTRLFTLLARISQLVRGGSQFIIATHSPILMAYPGADIFVLEKNGITKTPYEQTDHYVLTKRFLNDPQRILKHLLEE